jgi:hypothetical protein
MVSPFARAPAAAPDRAARLARFRDGGRAGDAFVAKIVLEMWGVTMFRQNPSRTFEPVPLAHLVGVVSCAVRDDRATGRNFRR